jgi:ketosteroid isomerase-like protein
MTDANSKAADEGRLHALVEGWTKAIRARDVDAVMRHYTADTLSFDLAPPLQHRSDAIRNGLAAWFASFTGPVGYEVRDLAIEAGERVAFGHSLNRISGARTDGSHTDVWVRATLCFRKDGGAWKLAHEHVSVPFHMDGSFRAAVDLKP